MELIDYIRKGIHSVEFFSYDTYEIKLRALSTMEFDEARDNAFNKHPAFTKLVLDLRLERVKLTEDYEALTPQMYKMMMQAYDEIDYYVVYLSMRDFMPDTFGIEDVMLMQNIHDMAKMIFGMSVSSKPTVQEVVRNRDGVELATIIYKFNQPLSSDAYKLTPLQNQFLYWSHPDAPKKVADTWEDYINDQLKAIGDVTE